jgi:hypothetical protein
VGSANFHCPFRGNLNSQVFTGPAPRIHARFKILRNSGYCPNLYFPLLLIDKAEMNVKQDNDVGTSVGTCRHNKDNLLMLTGFLLWGQRLS